MRHQHETRTEIYRGAKIMVWRESIATIKGKIKERPDGEWTYTKEVMAVNLEHGMQLLKYKLDLYWKYVDRTAPRVESKNP